MNPWQSLRSEINAAIRSVRYDIAARAARRALTCDTSVLPIIGDSPGSSRRRMFLAVGAFLVPVAGISGYLATASSVGALFPHGGPPAGLPDVAGRPAVTSPAPTASSDGGLPMRRPAASPPRTDIAARTTGPPRATPTGTPPVPTPAPTCGCPTPTGSPTASHSPSAKPSPSPTSSPTPDPSVTSSVTP